MARRDVGFDFGVVLRFSPPLLLLDGRLLAVFDASRYLDGPNAVSCNFVWDDLESLSFDAYSMAEAARRVAYLVEHRFLPWPPSDPDFAAKG